MKIPIYKVGLVVGYEKAGVTNSRGQLVRAFIGRPDSDEKMEVQLGEPPGVWMHARTKQQRQWWMSEQWLAEGDLVRVVMKVGIAGVGIDEERTGEMLYQVDPNEKVREVGVAGVGFKGYYLVKGRLHELARTSEAQRRQLVEIDPMSEEGYDEVRYLEVSDG